MPLTPTRSFVRSLGSASALSLALLAGSATVTALPVQAQARSQFVDYADLAEKVMSAVVNISTTAKVPVAAPPSRPRLPASRPVPPRQPHRGAV